MIIKIIPEKGETHIKEVEHHNIKEFLIFGNKKDADGELIDFHDWSGQYRYLIGSLYYFQGMLANEQSGKSTSNRPSMEFPTQPSQGMLKQIPSDQPNLQILKTENAAEVEEVEEVEEGYEMEVEEPVIQDIPVNDDQAEVKGQIIELAQPNEPDAF